MRNLSLIVVFSMIIFFTMMVGFGETPKIPALEKTPKEYQDKHMPKGWWTDSKVIAEGKKIYDGMVDPDVVCAACHGRDGRPILTGTRDLRDAEYVNKMTDSYMYWRTAEGVPKTPMTPWKGKLKEDQIWKVIAYTHTFSHGGKAEEHSHK